MSAAPTDVLPIPASAVPHSPPPQVPPPPQPDPPPDLPTLRTSILTRLALALDHAAHRLQLAAAGESVFRCDAEQRLALQLLHLLPHMLKHLPTPPPPRRVYHGIPLIPKCPICGKGPGAHHPDRCPDRDPTKPPPPLY